MSKNKDKSQPASKDAGKGKEDKNKKKFPTKLGAVAGIALLALFVMAGASFAYNWGDTAGGIFGAGTKHLTLHQQLPGDGAGEFAYETNKALFAFHAVNMSNNTWYTLTRLNTNTNVRTALKSYLSTSIGHCDFHGPGGYLARNGNQIDLILTADLGGATQAQLQATPNGRIVYIANNQPAKYLFGDTLMQ